MWVDGCKCRLYVSYFHSMLARPRPLTFCYLETWKKIHLSGDQNNDWLFLMRDGPCVQNIWESLWPIPHQAITGTTLP